MRAINATIMDINPPDQFLTKLVALSKSGSTTIDNEKMIRPIGVSNVVTKLLEKTIYEHAQRVYPKVFRMGVE